MTDQHCVIQADFSATRIIAGRKCLSLVFEVPIEQADDVLKKLGGFPQPGSNRWCAIALLDETKLGRDGAKIETPPSHPNGEHEVSDSVTTSSSAEGAAHPKKWSELKRPQQAFLLCQDPAFWDYFKCRGEGEAIEAIRVHFRIKSRSELDKPENHVRWDEFVALWQLHRDRHK